MIAGAFARLASDAALSAQQPCPLPDALQAEMALRNGLGVKPHAPITNLDTKTVSRCKRLTDILSLLLCLQAFVKASWAIR